MTRGKAMRKSSGGSRLQGFLLSLSPFFLFVLWTMTRRRALRWLSAAEPHGYKSYGQYPIVFLWARSSVIPGAFDAVKLHAACSSVVDSCGW